MSHSYTRYSDFKAEDFIYDPFFQEWVMSPDDEKDSFWKGFLVNFPDKSETLDRARGILMNISFVVHSPSDEMVQRSLSRHMATIENSGSGKVVRMRSGGGGFGKLLRVAAVFGGVVLSLFLLYQLFGNQLGGKMAVETEYGKLKQILLPDSSSIVLNANSKIEYSKNWKKENKREVWLKGEAFFDVRHLNQDTAQIVPHEQFIVHTDDLDVVVLGTSFNIRQRRGKTEVVLQTGSIKVTFKDSSRADVVMKPGEVVTYDPGSNLINRTTAVPENYTAWKDKQLILNNPTVNEIVTYLEDNFGKKIMLSDAKLGERKIEGPILLNNLGDALFVLSTVLNTRVVYSDSAIIIQPRKDL